MALWSWSVLQRHSGIADSSGHNGRRSDRDETRYHVVYQAQHSILSRVLRRIDS